MGRTTMTISRPVCAMLGAMLLTVFLAPSTRAQMPRGDVVFDAATGGKSYVVEFKGAGIPNGLPSRIQALGGRVVDTFPAIKVAVIAGLTDAAAATLATQPDVADVTRDEELPPPAPQTPRRPGKVSESARRSAGTDPTSAFAYPYQWNMRAIEADRAWAADDLGRPGPDPWYGHGRINVRRALGIL
jgi:hypothetical protein